MKIDLDNLRSLVKKNYGNEAYSKVLPSLESLLDRQDYAKYHYQEYKKLIDSKADFITKLEFVSQKKEAPEKIAIKANIIACMQNMHIIHDVLAYVISFSLNLGINEKDISSGRVKNHLTNLKKIEFANLLNHLKDLTKNPDFEYLNANVNHSKHRYHIDLRVQIDMAKPSHQIHSIFEHFSFQTYKYGELGYIRCDADAFLNTEYNREAKLIIEILNELINILEKNSGVK